MIFINQYCGALFIDVVNTFARKNVKCTLITGSIHPVNTDLHEKVRVIMLNRYNRKSGLTRIISWLYFSVCCFFVLLKVRRQPLFAVSNPPFASFVVYFIEKLRRLPYHLLIYDIYPDVLIGARKVRPGHPVVKLWERGNRSVFKHADRIFTISQVLSEVIRKYTAKEVHVVSSWADVSYIKPVERKDNWFSRKHGLHDKFTVLYSGNLGATHDIDSILGASKVLQNNKDISFLMIGEGTKKKLVNDFVKYNNLQNLVSLDYQPAEVLPYSMTAGDIFVVTLDAGVGEYSVPSKTYYAMASGACILAIAPETSELYNLVNELECGVCVAPGDPDKVAAAIEFLLNNEEELERYRKNALAASENFTPALAQRFYTHIFGPSPVPVRVDYMNM